MNEKIDILYNYLINKKCKDLAVYDLRGERLSYGCVMVLSCSDVFNNKNLANDIIKDFSIDYFPEGYNKGEWIIFDFDDVILHLFVPSVREKYNLDKLWQNKKVNIVCEDKKNKK